MHKVIITIPAYNEELTLPAVLEEIKSVMQGTTYKYEVVVVDDGSSDKTIEVMPWLKWLGNKAFSRVLTKLTNVKLTDTTTGFRAFTAAIARDIEYINTFTYTQEQIIKAAKQGFKITEIPIIARKTRESRLFKNPFQYAVRAWINIFRIYGDYEQLAFFGRIGALFIIIGFLIGAWLLYRLFTLCYIGRYPSIILSGL